MGTRSSSCARLARRRKFSRWHSKIAAPPFPEGSFRALSCSFIINNVILSCIPPFVYTRPARCSACGLSSRRIVVLWCARRSHVVAPRVYESPPLRATPCIDLTASVQPLDETIPATSATFARVRRDGVHPHSEEAFTANRATTSSSAGDPWTLLVVVDSPPTRRTQQVRKPALPTPEARASASLCHPPPARHRAARRALVTPTYSLPRTLPRNSSWCFHSSSYIAASFCMYMWLHLHARCPLLPPTHASGIDIERVCVLLSFSPALFSIYLCQTCRTTCRVSLCTFANNNFWSIDS